MADARLIRQMCEGLENRPFMVIDDRWQKNPCDGPGDVANKRFRDMRQMAEEMDVQGAIPGIWIRFLADRKKEANFATPEMRMSRCDEYLNLSHPTVLEWISGMTHKIVHE